MANWVKCTSILPHKAPVWVNLDYALMITWQNNRSRIEFMGDKNAYVEVEERPEQITKG